MAALSPAEVSPSAFKVEPVMSDTTSNTPTTDVVEVAPAPIVTSTSPSVACSPSRTSPAVSAVFVPSLSAT